MGLIPFYGATNPSLFKIERQAMDRPARVIQALDSLLPGQGVVLDIGAGDGFTAERLTSSTRRVIAIEPESRMRLPERPVEWVAADAEALPLASRSVDAAYATWAYFFSRGWDPSLGLCELNRVVRRGGVLALADNLGGDDFTALGDVSITADADFWARRGFECITVDTVFEFESPGDADRLLTAYFGPSSQHAARLSLSYRVGVFVGVSRGPSDPSGCGARPSSSS